MTKKFTDLSQILGTKYPFIVGGMANVSTGAFAAAASNAGAMGVIASGGMNPGTLRENILTARQLTDKPFGVNIMLKHPQADEFAQIVAELKVPFITTGAGNPSNYLPMWKEAGCTVFPVVAAGVLAKRVIESGADGVIAEGTESGGHVGDMATMSLVKQIADMVDVPVVAAGGIASGDQFLAAMALGACGVQMGTALLVSEECPIHDNYKQALLKASDSDTVVTGRSTGSPVRQLKNYMTRQYNKDEKRGATPEELETWVLGSHRKAVYDGDTKLGSLMAGQVAGMLHEIRPMADILDEIYNDAQASLAELNEKMAALYGREL